MQKNMQHPKDPTPDSLGERKEKGHWTPPKGKKGILEFYWELGLGERGYGIAQINTLKKVGNKTLCFTCIKIK